MGQGAAVWGKEAASCPCRCLLAGATGKGRGLGATVSVEGEREDEGAGMRERKREADKWSREFSEHRYACLPRCHSRRSCCYIWIEITAEECFPAAGCWFVCFGPLLSALCCDCTTKNQAEAEARASRHGRRKVKKRTKDEGEARGEDKRGKLISFPLFASDYTTMSLHWERCLWLGGLQMREFSQLQQMLKTSMAL